MNSTNDVVGEVIGVDYGIKRIGLARINTQACIPEALDILQTDRHDILQVINEFATQRDAVAIVVGLPRGLNGQMTRQSEAATKFAKSLRAVAEVPVFMIDEAGSSVEASARTDSRRVDAHAAGVFLEDFIAFKDKDLLRV